VGKLFGLPGDTCSNRDGEGRGATTVTLVELANSLGYDSEAAFSRAFKQIMGISPAAGERIARTDASADGFPLVVHAPMNLEIG